MKPMYYTRKGEPMSRDGWVVKIDDLAYRRVAETTLADGKWVSTVWLGLDHGRGESRPMIFETMVFPNKDDLLEIAMDRYATEEEAIAGHAAMVAKYST